MNQHFENPKVIEIQIFQKTQEFAIRDELTGLYNYRYFRSELEREIDRAELQSHSLSMVFFDVDHFKWYNDRNGHLAGDNALRTVAAIILSQVQDTDLVARYGGEEFVVLIPGASKRKAFELADRIRQKISEHGLPFADGQPQGKFSVNGGVATYRADAGLALTDAADKALYKAKACGKDCVLTAGDENREFPRLPLRISGELRRLSREIESFETDNASEQGFQFITDESLEVGELFRFSLQLTGRDHSVDGVGRVVKTTPKDSEFQIGARIFEISTEDLVDLRRFLRRDEDQSEG